LSRIPETEKCGESEEESDRGQAVDTRRERDREKGKDEGPFVSSLCLLLFGLKLYFSPLGK